MESDTDDDEFIDVNDASIEELQQLHGVTPSMALAIVEWRESNLFTCAEEIIDVPGVGPDVFEKNRDRLVASLDDVMRGLGFGNFVDGTDDIDAIIDAEDEDEDEHEISELEEAVKAPNHWFNAFFTKVRKVTKEEKEDNWYRNWFTAAIGKAEKSATQSSPAGSLVNPRRNSIKEAVPEDIEEEEELDLNTATKDELMELEGISEDDAVRIVSYRQKMGPVRSLADFCKIHNTSLEVTEGWVVTLTAPNPLYTLLFEDSHWLNVFEQIYEAARCRAGLSCSPEDEEKVFRSIDLNDSGKLDVHELEETCEQLGICSPELQPALEEIIAQSSHVELRLQDFRLMWRRQHALRGFARLFEAVVEEVGAEDPASIFLGMDADGDNFITYEELCEINTQYKAGVELFREDVPAMRKGSIRQMNSARGISQRDFTVIARWAAHEMHKAVRASEPDLLVDLHERLAQGQRRARAVVKGAEECMTWIDDSFMPSDAALWRDPDAAPPPAVIAHPLGWQALSEHCPNIEERHHIFKACDVRQGALGDAYMLDTLQGFVERCHDIKRGASHPERGAEALLKLPLVVDADPKAGIWAVQLWQNGEPRVVVVDDMVPVSAYSRDGEAPQRHQQFAAVGSGEASVWPPIIEKAYAKIKGAYELIDAGYAHCAMMDLLGGTSFCANLSISESTGRHLCGTWDLFLPRFSRYYNFKSPSKCPWYCRKPHSYRRFEFQIASKNEFVMEPCEDIMLSFYNGRIVGASLELPGLHEASLEGSYTVDGKLTFVKHYLGTQKLEAVYRFEGQASLAQRTEGFGWKICGIVKGGIYDDLDPQGVEWEARQMFGSRAMLDNPDSKVVCAERAQAWESPFSPLHQSLQANLRQGRLLSASMRGSNLITHLSQQETSGFVQSDGLSFHSEYPILGVTEITHSSSEHGPEHDQPHRGSQDEDSEEEEGEEREEPTSTMWLVQLLNTSTGRWNGSWRQDDPQWKHCQMEASAQKEVQKGFEEGRFWMSVDDFQSHFSTLTIGRVFDTSGDWSSRQSKGVLLPGELPPVEGEMRRAYEIRLSQSCEVVIHLCQPDTTIYGVEDSYPITLGFRLYRKTPYHELASLSVVNKVHEGGVQCNGMQLLADVQHLHARDATTEIFLECAPRQVITEYMYYVMPYSSTNAVLPFTIAVMAAAPFTMHTRCPPHLATLREDQITEAFVEHWYWNRFADEHSFAQPLLPEVGCAEISLTERIQRRKQAAKVWARPSNCNTLKLSRPKARGARFQTHQAHSETAAQSIPSQKQDVDEASWMFDYFDIDGNGVLSETELAGQLSDFGVADEEIEDLVAQMDVNSDGLVSREEFKAVYGLVKQLTGMTTPR